MGKRQPGLLCETFPIIDGRIPAFRMHHARFQKSAQSLGYAPSPVMANFCQLLSQLKEADTQCSRARIILDTTRPSQRPSITLKMLSILPFLEPIKILTYTPSFAPSHHKWAWERNDEDQPNTYETQKNPDTKNLREIEIGNIWRFHEETHVASTPACRDDIVPGVMRELLIDVLLQNGWDIRFEDVDPVDSTPSHTIGMTNAMRWLSPVSHIDGKAQHVNPRLFYNLGLLLWSTAWKDHIHCKDAPRYAMQDVEDHTSSS